MAGAAANPPFREVEIQLHLDARPKAGEQLFGIGHTDRVLAGASGRARRRRSFGMAGKAVERGVVETDLRERQRLAAEGESQRGGGEGKHG